MTEQDFIAELSSGLRVGPLTRRRIIREVSEHLKDRALARNRGDVSGEGLGEPRALAAAFTATYATRRRDQMEHAAGSIAFGTIATVIACAAILGVDADGDRLVVELPLVVAVTGILSLAVLGRSSAVLAVGLGVGAAAWLGWSAHLISLQAGVACVALLGIGVTSAAVAPRLLRSLREGVT